MKRQRTVIIDMTPDGEFRAPPGAGARLSWPTRIAATAALAALILGAITLAAFAFWLAVTLLPVILIAALIAYGAFRFQLWRGRGVW